jgi:cobalt/nickel transport system permease protein
MASPEPRAGRRARRDRALLAAWVIALFALSGVSSLPALGAAALAAALLFRRGLARSLGRTARAALPVTVGLSLASWAWLRAVEGAWPDPRPFAALALRTSLLAFLTFSTLARVDLLAALAPFPAASRLLVLTLAQIHALRLLATESLLGLRSRLPRRPGPLDVLRGAGGITGALLSLSLRNARDVADALRSRGF